MLMQFVGLHLPLLPLLPAHAKVTFGPCAPSWLAICIFEYLDDPKFLLRYENGPFLTLVKDHDYCKKKITCIGKEALDENMTKCYILPM